MPIRAVVADNQKMFVEGLQSILKEMKYPTLHIAGVAHSYNELIKFTHFPIDILIFDQSIVEKEFSGFISELKKAQPNIRTIILSNYGEPHVVREAFLHGIDGYVLKSNHTIELLQCIETVIDGKTYIADGLRLAPELVKSEVKPKNSVKMYEDRFLLRQKLTKREKQILSFIVQYKNNKTIAQELFISDQTVSSHRKRIMKKFGVNNTANLIKFTLDHQLV